jgi:hypothetical protein
LFGDWNIAALAQENHFDLRPATGTCGSFNFKTKIGNGLERGG